MSENRHRNHWQDDHGFPTDAYFEVVAQALEQAGVTLADWDRDEDWEVNYEVDPAVVQNGPMHNAASEGLYISWRTDKEGDPLNEDDFTGLGWYYVPYSKTDTALGDYVGTLPGPGLPYLAEPERVATAVVQLVQGASPPITTA